MAQKKTSIDYKKLTLDQLAALHEADDEELDEDEAFNSDDERQYGKYFDADGEEYVSGSSSSSNNCKSSYLGLSIAIDGDANDGGVIKTEIKKGHKMVLSSFCLDVASGDFRQIKLMVRCIYPGGNDTDDKRWLCLGNFLGQKNGGISIPPSVPISLEVRGQCAVEFKVEGKFQPSLASNGGSINIFGNIVPILDEILSDDDLSVDYADAFMSEKEEEDVDDDDKEDAASVEGENAATKSEDGKDAERRKRKLSNYDDGDADVIKKPSNNKLTKKARKQLAKEKTQQLEDTLSAARKDEANNDSKTPKKKKKNQTASSSSSSSAAATATATATAKPTSLTRERRLPSGVTVRDVLVGTGTIVKSGKKISLHYTGALLHNGKVFDKNHSKQHPLVFRQGTGEVIRGLERGLEGMKVGGERIINIPSKLGYGSKGAGVDIPPDSDLTFEVKLLRVG